MSSRPTAIEIDSLTLRYGERLIQRDLSFTIAQGDIFIIMGGSGCGKSTLLRHLIGLQTPAAGSVRFAGIDLWQADDSTRQAMQRRFGVLFQSGALWSSLTLSENIMLPMTEIGGFRAADARELAAVKLALVRTGRLRGFLSLRNQRRHEKARRAGRAVALDPDILFLMSRPPDLDPLSSAHLDELILELRDSLGATIVIVTHELASIFAIGDNAVFLDAETRTMIALGDPKTLRHSGPEASATFSAGKNVSKKTQPALIGAFVLGAITLAIAALFFVAGGDLWKRNRATSCISTAPSMACKWARRSSFAASTSGWSDKSALPSTATSNRSSSRSKSSSSPNPLSISTGSRWTSATRWLRASSSPGAAWPAIDAEPAHRATVH